MKYILSLVLLTLVGFNSIAQEKPRFVPGNIIVQVPGKDVSALISENQQFNGVPTHLELNRLLSEPMAAYLLEFNPNINHHHFLQQLWKHPSVTLIQLNHYIQHRATTPNDPQLGQQWWHINDGSGGGTADADIDSDEAWDITTGGVTALGDTIVVCVVDDGGDLDHPDLMANNWINHHEIPNNGIDDDGNGYVDDYLGWNPVNDNDDIDNGSHGVNVAGMIGAVGNNNTGVVGVNWNVKIMNMTYGSIGSVNNPNEANVIEAYTYPLIMRRLYEQTNGAKGAYVVATNSSWGLDGADPLDAPLWCAFYDTLGHAGILSAGSTANNNVNIDVVGDLPTGCSSEYLISVTATNNADVRTFSGYGQTTVDLGAPGEDVRTTAPGGNYTTTSGTSFAGPATAGAIALAYAAPCSGLAAISHSNPAVAAQMVRDAIFSGVDPVTNLTTECVTGGRLNLKGMLDHILNTCPSGGCLPPFSITAQSVTDVEATINWSSLTEIDTFHVSYGLVGGLATIDSNLVASTFQLTNLDACSDYWFTAQSVCDGQVGDWSDTLFFQTDGCCLPPNLLSLSNPTEDGITATWTPVLAANSYLIQWRPLSGGTWTQQDNITGTSFALTALDPCTNYEVQIATNCTGSTTAFTASETIRTSGCGACTDLSYCTFEVDNYFEWIGNVTIDMLNNTSQDEIGGYGDYTDLSVDLQRGQQYAISLTPSYGGFSFTEFFRVWIDFNQDGSFTTNEMVYSSTNGTTSTVNGNVQIPFTAELGSTRMRVSMTDNSNFPNGPCDEIQYGEIEDYCVTILEEDPVNPGITEVSGTFGLEVYPIPASKSLTLNVLNEQSDAQSIVLVDATGRTVARVAHNGLSTQQLDISSLLQGVYFIELQNKQQQVIGRARFLKH